MPLQGTFHRMAQYFNWFVVSTPLKNISRLGLFFPLYGKIKFMFQTTKNPLVSVKKSHTVAIPTSDAAPNPFSL